MFGPDAARGRVLREALLEQEDAPDGGEAGGGGPDAVGRRGREVGRRSSGRGRSDSSTDRWGAFRRTR